jgi:hypothetical protein
MILPFYNGATPSESATKAAKTTVSPVFILLIPMLQLKAIGMDAQ